MAAGEIAGRGLVLLGCGKMGSALLAGWLKAGLSPDDIWILTPHPSGWLAGLGVHLNDGLPRDPAVAIIAVKPQKMAEALPVLEQFGNGDTLFISVAAGTTIASMASILGGRTPIVRAMPNTPAMVGRGISGLCRNGSVSDPQFALARDLMAAVGEVVELDDESQIDLVTGISGSGPAYVFYLIEALAAAGEAEGLPPDTAMRLARATICGAGELAWQSGDSAGQLRANVTSPGGTTAAALQVLMDDRAGMAPLMQRAVRAAISRSREMGRG